MNETNSTTTTPFFDNSQNDEQNFVIQLVANVLVLVISIFSIWSRVTAFFVYQRMTAGLDRWLAVSQCASEFYFSFGSFLMNVLGMCSYWVQNGYCDISLLGCFLLRIPFDVGFTASMAVLFSRCLNRLLWNPLSVNKRQILVGSPYVLTIAIAAISCSLSLVHRNYDYDCSDASREFQFQDWANCCVIFISFLFGVTYIFKLRRFLLKNETNISLIMDANTSSYAYKKILALITWEFLAPFLYLMAKLVLKGQPQLDFYSALESLSFLPYTTLFLLLYYTIDIFVIAWLNQTFKSHFCQAMVTRYGFQKNLPATANVSLFFFDA